MGAIAESDNFVSWTFEGQPGMTLHIALFSDVTNCRDLQAKVKAGEMDPEVSMLNAAVVASAFVVRVAAQKALASQQRGKLITKSLHAELVYNMSGSRHISESFNRFGVTDSCKHLLVARYDAQPDELQAIAKSVAGQPRPLSDLDGLLDKPLVTKYYKVSPNEFKVGSLADAALLRIAARDC